MEKQSNIEFFFYVQFALTLVLGLGLPLLLANRRWSRALPEKYGSLTAIAYMFPSILGVFCALMIIAFFQLVDPAAAATARKFHDSPGAMMPISGLFFGYLILIPLFLVAMRLFYSYKKMRHKNHLLTRDVRVKNILF